MNEITITSGDLLTFVAAIAASFALAGIYRLCRSVFRQRRAAELAERALKVLTDRCDRQQMSMTRLDQELNDMRQAMLKQAMTMLPMHGTTPASAAARMNGAVAPISAMRARHNSESQPVRAPAARRSAGTEPPVRPAAFAKPQRPPRPDPKPTPISPAQLARTGAKAEVLMSRCNLSRAEAELVLAVHGAAAAAG